MARHEMERLPPGVPSGQPPDLAVVRLSADQGDGGLGLPHEVGSLRHISVKVVLDVDPSRRQHSARTEVRPPGMSQSCPCEDCRSRLSWVSSHSRARRSTSGSAASAISPR